MKTVSLGVAAALLDQALGVPAISRSQFNARVRNLVRLGIFPGVTVGRGKAHGIDAVMLTQLCVAVQITLLGVRPELAVDVVHAARIVNGTASVPLMGACGVDGGELRFRVPDLSDALK